MPKTLPERIFFTIVMAAIMVYGMIVYNVALNTNGVTNATFVMALHEMPIMVPVAFVLEFFVVEKLATKLAFLFMRPADRPQFITYAISLMIVCIMCPVMSLVATLLFKEPSFGMWVHTWGCNMPMALFLSARDADADRLFGLGLGADDYLTKPFLMQELLLRVQHILQRAYRAELSRTKPAPLQLGERCVDLNDAIVTLPEGKTLTLTATELALLRKLAENRGHIVTYDALCAAVWGADYYGYENSLGVHIRHLREKLEAEPGAPQFLRTVRGIGYKLTKGEEA